MPADHHNNLPAVIAFALLALLVVMLCSCTETRTDKQADTEKRDTFTVEGDAAVPLPQGGTTLVPVRFTVERVGSERLVEHSESKTQIDSAAIAQQVGGMLGKTLDAAIAKLTGLQMSHATSNAWGGPTPTEGGLAGVALTGASLYLREMLARKREQQALREVKQQRDAAHAKNIELAERVPPPDGDA
jgi:hypothetical protein